jgi:4-hydroxy-tetrahydrodipicolinate synthase
MLMGGKGDVSVTANVAPRDMQQMCMAAISGDRQQAEARNGPLMALHQGLFVQSNPIPVKWALQQMGLIGQGIRLPMTWLSAEHHGALKNALQSAGVL